MKVAKKSLPSELRKAIAIVKKAQLELERLNDEIDVDETIYSPINGAIVQLESARNILGDSSI
jgi:hypothetical protein